MGQAPMNSASNRPRAAGVAMSLLTLTALAIQLPAQSVAAPINHGNFFGATVDYLDVTEDTNSGDTQPLFGAPTISGDSLDFDPVGFSANSSGGGPPDQTDGQLSFMISAKGGNVIETLSLTEAGDTSLARSIVSLEDAYTRVTANIFVDILEVDYAPVAMTINANGVMTFTPSGGEYFLSVDGAGNPTYNTSWTGNFFLELDPILAANGITGKATKIGVNLDNTLTASSGPNSSALIAKKDFDGVVITVNPDPNVVPEPSTCVLAAIGMLAAFGARRFRV